jgi:uncharacterized protein YukE
MRKIAVDTGTLNRDIVQLRTALSGARLQLDDMFKQIEQLDTMWEGPANAEFNIQFGNDYDNTKSMFDTIDSLIECMEYARDQYNLCENEVDSIVKSIQI